MSQNLWQTKKWIINRISRVLISEVLKSCFDDKTFSFKVMLEKDEPVTITDRTLDTILHNARKPISYFYYIFRINGRKHYFGRNIRNYCSSSKKLFDLQSPLKKALDLITLSIKGGHCVS